MTLEFRNTSTPKHQRLPSFTELTANFSSNLSVNEQEQQPYQYQLANQQTPLQQQVIQHNSSPIQFSNPFNQEQLKSYRFPAVTSNQPVGVAIPNSNVGLNKYSINNGHDRRLSLQLPQAYHQNYNYNTYNYGNYNSNGHEKNDSINSQYSLDTLADIASFRKTEPSELFRSIEEMIINLEKFQYVSQSLNNELIKDLKNSKIEKQNNNELISFQTLIKYKVGGEDNNEELNFITKNQMNSFLKEISLIKLRELLNMNNEIHDTLKQWIVFKEHEDFLERAREEERLAKQKKKAAAIEQLKKQKQAQNEEKKKKKMSTSGGGGGGDGDTSSRSMKSGVTTCRQCGSDDTPEWRRGPYGSRSLCNACGLFYGKLIKKFGFELAGKIMIERKNAGQGDDRKIPTI